MKTITQKQLNKKYEKMEIAARKWLDKGYTPKQVAAGIWNRWGYLVEIKNNEIQVWGDHKIVVRIKV